ncbi:MAG: DMT family transporter [Acidobacteria bacterium]|nr:DMT family transporter [Acidobacteriota bacterium]
MWGGSFVAVKVALRELSPPGVVAARAALGCALVGLAGLARARRSPARDARRSDALILVLLGVLGIPVHLGLQAWALTQTSAVHSGWLVALNPVFVVLLSVSLFGERLSPTKALGTLVGFAGAFVVITGGRAWDMALPATRGDLVMLASTLNWAAYTVIARRLMLRRDPLEVTSRALAVGAAVAVAGYLVQAPPAEFLRASPPTWAALAYLGLGCTGAGYLFWAAALRRVEAGTLSTLHYPQPLVTALAAALLLGEPWGLAATAGGVLALAGVVLVQREGARA